jgi:hypothetical protein
MTSRKGKENISPEYDFSFRPETKAIRRRSSAIKISPRSERDAAQPSSAGRKDENVPQEVSNLRGQLILPKTPMDDI